MPSDALPVRRVALALTVVAVLAAGVLVFAPAGETDAQPHVGHDAADRLAALDGLNATVESTFVRGNETTHSVRRVSVRPGTGELRSVPVDGDGVVMVSNGSTMWLYRPADREVTRVGVGDAAAGAASRQGERIERLFNRLNVSPSAVDERETATASPRLVPLPVVPAGSPPGAGVDGAVNRTSYGVRYEGTDTVSGREVYVLALRPAGDGGGGGQFGNYTQRLFVDAEWFLPLRTHTEWTLDGEQIEATTVYRNLSFEPGLPDSLFQFDPPPGVEVSAGPGPTVTSYDSVSALRANTSVPVPDPDLPASFGLVRAQTTTGVGEAVSLRYTNATASLTVTASRVPNATRTNGTRTNATRTNITRTNGTDALPDGERVSVGTETGIYRQVATSRVLTWSCGDVQYSVLGTGVSRDLVVELARSVGCG